MQLLRAYQEQYPQVIFDDPPPTAPYRTASAPPQSLQSGFSHSSHNNSSMLSQPSYQSQYGEMGREMQVRPADTLSPSSIYPQPIQPTLLSAPSDIYPRNPVQCTSVPGSANPATEPAPPPKHAPLSPASLYPTSKMLDQRKRKNTAPEEIATVPGYPPQMGDEQPPQSKRTCEYPSSSFSSTFSYGHEGQWLQPCEERQQPSLGNEPFVGNQIAARSSSTSILPTQESSSRPLAGYGVSAAPATSVGGDFNTQNYQCPQQSISHEPPDVQVHAQESSREPPGARPVPPSNTTVFSKHELLAVGKRSQGDEAPPSINVAVSKEQRLPVTSSSAPYNFNPSHYRGSAISSDEYPSHTHSARSEYSIAHSVSPNQHPGETTRFVSPTYSGQLSLLQHMEKPATYTTHPSYVSGSSVENGGSFTSAGSISSGEASSGGSMLSSFGTSFGSEYSSSPANTRQTQPSNRSSIERYRPSSGEGDSNLAASGERVEEEEGGGEEQRSWIGRTFSSIFRKLTGSGQDDTNEASSDEYKSCDEDPSTND